MRRLIIYLALILYSAASFSQPKMAFSVKEHDFGIFRESEGKQTFHFEVVNKGNAPLVIQNIVASCGCTTPEWTKTPIAPGNKGTITAIFDPANRAGKFSKNLSVYSNSDPSPVTLTLKGEVLPREKTLEDYYAWAIGPVRFESSRMAFATILKTGKKIRVMPLVNASKETVEIDFTDLPPHLEMKAVPSKLKPGQKGLVQCTYNATRDPRWGNVDDRIKVTLNGVVQQAAFYVAANLAEDFSLLSKAEIENAPVFRIEASSVDLGILTPDKVKDISIRVANDGKRDLLLRRVWSPCACITVGSGSDTLIKPGSSGIIKLTFRPEGYVGKLTKAVYINTNDPKNGQINILVKSEIKLNSGQKQ